MKYKVSLLPEKNRKRILGKKKAVKAKSIALVILLVLLANVLVLTICFTFAQTQKSKIVALNNEYEQKVSALQKYRDINTNLQNKINLIKSIQVDEPSLYNFLAHLGNTDHTGITLNTIDCTDWKSSRNCNITGTAQSRELFNEFLKELEENKNFKSVSCTSYVVSVVEGKATAEFSITITCDGGSAPTTAPAETNADGTPVTTEATTAETTVAE